MDGQIDTSGAVDTAVTAQLQRVRDNCGELLRVLENETRAGNAVTFLTRSASPVDIVITSTSPGGLIPTASSPSSLESELQDLERKLVGQLRDAGETADAYARVLLVWGCMARPFAGYGFDDLLKPGLAARDGVQAAAVSLLKAMDSRGSLADDVETTLNARAELIIKARVAGKATPTPITGSAPVGGAAVAMPPLAGE